MTETDDIFDRYSRLEQRRPVRIPDGFADRVVRHYASEQRHAARRRLFAGLGLLAASLLITWSLWPSREIQPIAKKNNSPPATNRQPSLTEQWAQAGAAIESLTEETKGKTLKPTRTLLAPAESMSLPGVIEPPSLPDVTFLSRDSLEPVTGQPRRAVQLFLRDFGIAPR